MEERATLFIKLFLDIVDPLKKKIIKKRQFEISMPRRNNEEDYREEFKINAEVL